MPLPEVPEYLLWIWRCFQRLTIDRPWHGGGMGPAIPGAIPWTTVMAWCDHHGYEDAEVTMLDTCIKEMDACYIQHYHDKAKR